MKVSLQLFNPGLFEVQKVKVIKEFASEFELFAGKFFRIHGDIQITEVYRAGNVYRLLLRGIPNTETIIEAAIGDDIGVLYRITVKDKDTAIIEVYMITPK